MELASMEHLDLSLVNEKLVAHRTTTTEMDDDLDMAECQNVHPLRHSLASQVNNQILAHWDFDSETQKHRFLQRDLTGLACLAFPFALDDRIELIARLFSIVYLLGELVAGLEWEDAEECLESLREAVMGYWQPDREQAAVWMLCDLFDEIRAHDYRVVDDIIAATWRYLDLRVFQRGRRSKRANEIRPFQDAFLAAGLEYPLHRFATGDNIDEE